MRQDTPHLTLKNVQESVEHTVKIHHFVICAEDTKTRQT